MEQLVSQCPDGKQNPHLISLLNPAAKSFVIASNAATLFPSLREFHLPSLGKRVSAGREPATKEIWWLHWRIALSW